MSENTKKRSLDKLFGTKEVRDAPSDAAGNGDSPPSPTARKPAAKKGRSKGSKRSTAPKPSKKAAEPEVTEDAGPGGYLGEGRYRRGDGVMEKPSIYVRPDQARALRMAAAAKDDPNGKTMSDIIQSLLDQHGYRDPK